MTNPIKPIETRYAGCRFRSRLEARWAVLFDHLNIRWEYEPQGFEIDGTAYLPDFLLVESGTWVEIKGDPAQLDGPLMEKAALTLPPSKEDVMGPTLLLLGSIPRATTVGNWAWIGLTRMTIAGQVLADAEWYGFKPGGIAYLSGVSTAPACDMGDPPDTWLTPELDEYSDGYPGAYRAARAARFEHGEQG